MRIPEVGTVVAQAERAERLGWDGITFTDSQNLVGDPFVAVALAAKRDRGGCASRPVSPTRTPATPRRSRPSQPPCRRPPVAASCSSIGRRRHTAMFHLGRKPMPVAAFIAAVTDLQTYLANGTVDSTGKHPSRLQWLDRCTQPKVAL